MGATIVEREEELEVIARRLDRASNGVGGALLLEGPAGIGKTTLARAARELAAEHEMRVFEASGSELEREYPLGVARQCLEPTVRRLTDAERLLRGAAKLAEPVLTGIPEPLDATPVGLIHGLYWLVVNLAAESPLLIVIDDAHWADEPSLRFLVYLARRLESLPLLLLVGARSNAEDPVLDEFRVRRSVSSRSRSMSPASSGCWIRSTRGRSIRDSPAPATTPLAEIRSCSASCSARSRRPVHPSTRPPVTSSG